MCTIYAFNKNCKKSQTPSHSLFSMWSFDHKFYPQGGEFDYMFGQVPTIFPILSKLGEKDLTMIDAVRIPYSTKHWRIWQMNLYPPMFFPPIILTTKTS